MVEIGNCDMWEIVRPTKKNEESKIAKNTKKGGKLNSCLNDLFCKNI